MSVEEVRQEMARAAAFNAGAAEAHAQYRPAVGHADLAAWLDPFGEAWLLPATNEPSGWRRLYIRDGRNLESAPANPSLTDMIVSAHRMLKDNPWYGKPPTEQCPECGPGYRVLGDGCRHDPTSNATAVSLEPEAGAPTPVAPLREQLAAIEHERWAHWQRYMHNVCVRSDDGRLTIPSNKVEHWERQMATPYADLSEREKDSDREQVDRYLPLIAAHFAAERDALAAEVERLRAELKALQADRVVTAVFGHHPGAPRPFGLYRREDETGVSGTGVVALGCEFPDGLVVLRWTSAWPTSVVFHERGIESVEAIHGHGGKTKVVWLSEEFATLADFEQRAEQAEAERGAMRPVVEAASAWASATSTDDIAELGPAMFRAIATYRALATYDTKETEPVYLVWSNDAGSWWRPNGSGYTGDVWEAGRYSEAEAVKACGMRTWSEGCPPPEVMVLAPEHGVPAFTVDAIRAVHGLMRDRITDETQRRMAVRAAADTKETGR